MVRKIGAAVRFEAKPGEGGRLARALADAGQTVARRAGTELWLVHVAEDAPDTVWLWEVFASEESRRAAQADPAYCAARAGLDAMLAAPPVSQGVIPVAGKGLMPPPG